MYLLLLLQNMDSLGSVSAFFNVELIVPAYARGFALNREYGSLFNFSYEVLKLSLNTLTYNFKYEIHRSKGLLNLFINYMGGKHFTYLWIADFKDGAD